ncbi:MAG TPA: serine protease [Pyrinomonadaceae bacterium]|nr:serine protease [Pyrinomonadaceae bacterium]
MRTKFVLAFLAVFIAFISVSAQDVQNVTIKVAVVDKDLNVKNVPKFLLTVAKKDNAFAEWKVATGFDGVARLTLPSGEYVVTSKDALQFGESSYAWSVSFNITEDAVTVVELSNDNAKVAAGSSGPRRRVSEAAELFKTLRNGVVTIEGELAAGTGFVFDERGLVLTNHHVIEDTNDIRVRFDRKTAVRARLIAKDVERDLAVLQINLSAFADSHVLPLAKTDGPEPAVIVGEHVFSIGSPANQDKILTAGIVSKIEPRSIISDISFGKGSAGGPLFNSVGEVVGITTFRVEEREGLKKDDVKDSDFAGIIRIEVAELLIAKAREIVATKGTPSAELMPYLPDGLFPIETIKTSLTSPQFASSQYVSDVKDYQVRYMTPVYKFYMIEKDRIESLKIRERRNKDKGKLDAGEMFKDLRVWKEYAGELAPGVDILALPETTATMKSMALSAITNMTVGYSTPLDHKYKADFSQMKLLCDGKEVTPVRRTKTEIARDLQNYYKTKKRYTYAGVYTYPYEVFAPGRCSEMVVHVFSEEDIETPIVSTVTDAIKNRIWNDFADFRSQSR